MCSLLVGLVVAEKEAIIVWLGCCGPHLSCHLSPSLNSWTQYLAFN